MLVIENPIFNSSISPADSNSNTRNWHLLFQSGELKIDEFENAAMFR
jgi:hypothetical protein